MNDDRICCDMMRNQLTQQCDQHPDPHDCPDVLVTYDPVFDEYGMPIRDGGSSFMNMRFCPWCGAAMPESKRVLWFGTLAEMGIEDPPHQGVPDEFKTDVWWRSRG